MRAVQGVQRSIRRFTGRFRLVTAAAFVLAIAPAAQAASTYAIVNVGTLGGAESVALGLNADGAVVGYSTIVSGERHAFLYRAGELRDLGTLGGGSSSAAAINAAGVVVGESKTASGETHAFVYSDGAMHDLGTLGGPYSRATAINGAGVVVGESTTAEGQIHAFAYSDGVMRDLGTLGGTNSGAYGINDAGQIVGWSQTPPGFASRAFLYSDGVMTDLGVAGEAWSINSAGRVAGTMPTSAANHAFLRSDGGAVDIGVLDYASYARAINAGGDVVGYSTNAQETASYAFLYSAGALRDLNRAIAAEAGWFVLRTATAVNDAGQIAGTGVRPLGFRGFVMSPLPDVSLGEKPSELTQSVSARFGFSSTEGALFACKLDDGLFARCEGSAAYEGLADGRHTFTVRATDRFGTGPETSHAWTVDTVAPAAAVASGPPDPTSSTSAAIAFSSEAGARFECALDGGAYAACASPANVGPLPDGRHTFAVRAIDAAGNVGSPATHAWTVDTVAPNVVLAQPNDKRSQTSFEFYFSTENGSRLECSLDSAPFAPCTSPMRHEDLQPGWHAFYVRAVDRAGNVGPAAVRRFEVRNRR